MKKFKLSKTTILTSLAMILSFSFQVRVQRAEIKCCRHGFMCSRCIGNDSSMAKFGWSAGHILYSYINYVTPELTR